MADIVQSVSTLTSELADNTSGAITAQIIRNMFVSLMSYFAPITGAISQGTASTVIDLSATEGYTINSIVTQTTLGTATVGVQIAGTAVTGISAVSASTTLTTTNATGANTVAAGQTVTLTLSNATGGSITYFKINRTMA